MAALRFDGRTCKPIVTALSITELTFRQIYFTVANMQQKTPLEEAIWRAGGYGNVAKACGLDTRQAVWQWHKRRIPAEHCVTLERLSGVPRHRLRPDLWPAPTAAE